MVFYIFIDSLLSFCFIFFFFNDTATTEIYTLSLHDALPICEIAPRRHKPHRRIVKIDRAGRDRKSTRLNSSHLGISYAVFCLKKKNKHHQDSARKKKNQQTKITTTHKIH